MAKKITVSFELLDGEDSTYRELMNNFASQSEGKGIRVYAVTRGCLHEQVEQIEDALESCDPADIPYEVGAILGQV